MGPSAHGARAGRRGNASILGNNLGLHRLTGNNGPLPVNAMEATSRTFDGYEWKF